MTSEIRLMTWNINQLCGQTQGSPRNADVEGDVPKVVDEFLLALDGPAIVALEEVPSKNGEYPGPEPDPAFVGHLRGLGCDSILFDKDCGKGRNSRFKTVMACRAIDVEAIAVPDAWRGNRENRYIPFRVTMGDCSATFLALHADGADGLGDVLDHLASWNEAASPRVVLLGDFNSNGEGRKAIKGFVDAHPEGDTRIEHHSPDTVMYRGVSVEDVVVDCECSCSDHFLLTCTVKL